MFKKIGQIMKDMVAPSVDDGVLLGQEDVNVNCLREKLLSAITANDGSSDIVRNIIEIETDNFAVKYAVLDVKQLLNQNSQSVKNLQNIVSGLSLIIKYAQLLLKKKEQYKSIPLSNVHVQSKILPMNGSRYILCQLGYSQQTNTSLSFPPNTVPDIYIVANLLADMLLFKAEMKYYLSGSHISPQQIDALLPPDTIMQLNQSDQSDQDALDVSMLSIALDNTKQDQSSNSDTSPYYSALSSVHVSSEFSPTEKVLLKLEEEGVASKGTPLKKEMPGEHVTLRELAIEEVKEEFETSSLKTPSSGFKISCSLCNEEAQTMCKTCMNKLLCENCDADWHSHPSRRNHVTEKISEMDLTNIPSAQDNIVKGPYGIIAQTENPAALISKKIQAAASSSDKVKKVQDVHNSEMGHNGGNMPDFGSIMSGNMETVTDDRNRNNYSQQQNTQRLSLQTRGGNDQKVTDWGQSMNPAERGFGPPHMLQQQHQQQHQQQQHQQQHMSLQQHLPQFLQDNDNNNGFDNQHPLHYHQQQHQHYPFLVPSTPLSLSSQSQSSSSVPSLQHSVQGIPIQGQRVDVSPFYPGQPLPSVSHVQGVPTSTVQGVPYVSTQGHPIVQGHHVPNSQVQGHPLRLQMPPVSTFHNFQQSGGNLNNQQNNSSHQFFTSPQQLQLSYFSPPEPIQGYKVQDTSTLSGVGDYVVAQPLQQRHNILQSPEASYPSPHTGYYSGRKDLNTPVSFSTSHNANLVHTTNSWDMIGQSQQQEGVSQSSVQDNSDKEETFVQLPRRSLTMANPVYPAASSKPTIMHVQSPQASLTSAPKQSQTYPQLPSMMASDEDHNQQKQQQQRSDGQMSSSYSTSSLTASNQLLRVIQWVKAQPDASSQRLLCYFKIEELSIEVQEIQKEIDELMMEDFDSYSKEVNSRMKKKKELLKMKKELEKVLIEIKTSANYNSEVYYPPISDPGKQQSSTMSPVEKTKSGIRGSPTKRTSDESSVEDVASVEFSQTVSKGNDRQVEQHQLPLSSVFKPNTPGIESITDNTSHKRPPTIQPNDPPQHSLKADALVAKSDNNSLSQSLKWPCVHCTFLNNKAAKVCGMCDKTTGKQYYIRYDGNAEFVDPEDTPKLQVTNSAKKNEFVCHKVKNLSQRMQQEEEKLMEEKKKAWEDFWEKTKNSSPISAKKQSPKRHSSYDSGRKTTPSESGSDTRREEGAGAAGFSELARRNDTGSANSSMGNQTSPVCAASVALERLKEAHACDSLRKDGETLIRYMKEADIAGYPVDAVPIAISFCDTQMTSVMGWLDKHWENNLNKIVNEVANIASDRQQNDIGHLSKIEAQAACIECQGNLKRAVGVCIRKREELFKHLNGIDSYPREEILRVMFTQQGNKEMSELELVKHKLEGFNERIWSKGGSLKGILHHAGTKMEASHATDTCASMASSALEHDTFQRLISDITIDKDRRIRMILVEGKLQSWGRAEMVIDILDSEDCNTNTTLQDIVDSVYSCFDRKNALACLNQECQICFDHFPMGKIANLNFCNCKVCRDCLKGNFVVVIKEKHVRHWTCPICSLPDMNNEEITIDYLQMLQLLLSPVVTPDLMTLFEDKVRDFSLQKDPSFRWCAHCGNGFLADNIRDGAMRCDHCNKKTCFTCKRIWEPQHEGLTCEQFDQWKIENDPNNQAIGLARHLEENGIDCPKCNMRYSLAKGGCMHFKCPQCGHEFCSGCYESFNHQGVCKKYKSCASLGFHCHHPRDCFSFLRDNAVEELQLLLETNQVAFNTQVPEDQENKKQCPVMEQKEEGSVKTDDMCGKEVDFEMAGLCQAHYKEYLTGLINKHALDPVHLMTSKEIINLFSRYDMKAPSKDTSETDQNFKEMLIKVVQEELPLNRKKLDRQGE